MISVLNAPLRYPISRLAPLFFFLGILFLFCPKEKTKVRKEIGKRTLFLEYSSEKLFPSLPPQFNLFSSPHQIIVADLLPQRGKEIIISSRYLPALYILSPNLFLLKKLPAPSSPPKLFKSQGRDILLMSDGKSITSFPKNLIPPFRVKEDFWLKDFFLYPSKEQLWTIEEKGDEFLLHLYTLRKGRNGEWVLRETEEDRFPCFPKIIASSPTLFFWCGQKVFARGKYNWEISLEPNLQLVKASLSQDNRSLFLILSDSVSKEGKFFSLSVEDGQMLSSFPESGQNSFSFNDFILSDLDGDGKEEVILTYSGKKAGILILRDKKIIAHKVFSSSFPYSQITAYLLGVYPSDAEIEIFVNLRFEREEKTKISPILIGENWLYRLSSKLKFKDAIDLEDQIGGIAQLPDGFLFLGENLSLYKWE